MTAAVAVVPTPAAPPNSGGATAAAGTAAAAPGVAGAAATITGFDALLALLIPGAAAIPATGDTPAAATPTVTDKSDVKTDDTGQATPPDAASALASLMLLIAPAATQDAPAQDAAAKDVPTNTAPPASLPATNPSKPTTILIADPKAALPTANDNAQAAASDAPASDDANAIAARLAAAAPLAAATVAAAQAQTTRSAPLPAPRAVSSEQAQQPSADTAKPAPAITVAPATNTADSGQTPSGDTGDHAERDGGSAKADIILKTTDSAAQATDTAPANAAQAAQTATQVKATPQTVTHLAAQIVSKAGPGGKITQFDVTLDPQGLGQVTVQLRIAADGALSAAMRFDTPQAAAELRARSDELQRALTQAGFQLQDGALSFDVAGDGRHAGGQSGHDQGLFDLGARALRAAATLSTDGAPSAAQLIAATRAAAGGVDIRI